MPESPQPVNRGLPRAVPDPISADPKSRFYSPLSARADVYIDGKLVKYVVEASARNRYIICYFRDEQDHLVFDREMQQPMTYRREGHVELKWMV